MGIFSKVVSVKFGWNESALTKELVYLHLEGLCEAKSPVKPVTPKKNPAQSPVPIFGMKLPYKKDSRWLKLLNNTICVIAAIPAQNSWIVLSILIGVFDTNSFILTISGGIWGGGEFIIIGLLDDMMPSDQLSRKLWNKIITYDMVKLKK